MDQEPLCVCLFDDARGGHHPGFLSGIVRALLSVGIGPMVAVSRRPESLDGIGHIWWVDVKSFGLRQPLRGRRIMSGVVAKARRQSASAFWDLNLDKNVWALPLNLRTMSARAHVLHRVTQYNLEHRYGYARGRTRFLRARLRQIQEEGAVIVVHTEAAAAVLRSFLSSEVAVLGLPVTSMDQLKMVERADHDSPTLLFVGAARPGKGLAALLEATSRLKRWAPFLEVVGHQPEGVRADMAKRYPEAHVRWTDAYVDEAALSAAYQRASIAVVPYQDDPYAFGWPASTVVLEAMAGGVPLVVTPVLSGQLPPSYGGAVIAPGADPESLAAGIDDALSRLASLRFAAMSEGPDHISRHHTFEHYVSALLRATRV